MSSLIRHDAVRSAMTMAFCESMDGRRLQARKTIPIWNMCLFLWGQGPASSMAQCMAEALLWCGAVENLLDIYPSRVLGKAVHGEMSHQRHSAMKLLGSVWACWEKLASEWGCAPCTARVGHRRSRKRCQSHQEHLGPGKQNLHLQCLSSSLCWQSLHADQQEKKCKELRYIFTERSKRLNLETVNQYLAIIER